MMEIPRDYEGYERCEYGADQAVKLLVDFTAPFPFEMNVRELLASGRAIYIRPKVGDQPRTPNLPSHSHGGFRSLDSEIARPEGVA